MPQILNDGLASLGYGDWGGSTYTMFDFLISNRVGKLQNGLLNEGKI